MAHIFGSELRKIPVYTNEGHVESGHIMVHEDGIIISDGKDFKMPVHKALVESLAVQKALAANKFEVGLRYYNHMGSSVEMAFVLADEDYKYLAAKFGRR